MGGAKPRGSAYLHFHVKYLDSMQETIVNGAICGASYVCSTGRGSGKSQTTLGQMISTCLKLEQKRTA